MVNHRIHDSHPTGLAEINGHVPMASYNENTGDQTVWCNTCFWVGRSYRGRWAVKADEQWRVHAGDLAMRVEAAHGTPEYASCHCAKCRIGRRQRRAEAKS